MTRRPARPTTLAAALIATAGLAAGGGAATYAALSSGGTKTVVRQVTVHDAEPTASTSALSVNQIYRRSYKGVVEIAVSAEGGASPFGEPQSRRAQGSGFVYDRSGHIVTNQHVVDGADSISVRLWNGSTYKATVVGTDASTDLAVIKIDAPASLLAPLALGDSSKLVVGDGVVAIGSPFGLEQTTTSGIVSAVHRQITAPNNFAIANAIQTDAAINHGNSGGPLLNAHGQVIGVNAQIESESGGNDGVGFAVPSNTVRPVISQLLKTGEVEHAYLGVTVGTIPAGVAAELRLATGAEVTGVRSGTPASRAGLRAARGSRTVDGQSYPTGGDVITAVDGGRITSAAELQGAIDAKRPGETISVTYVRNGKSRTVDVKLARRPS